MKFLSQRDRAVRMTASLTAPFGERLNTVAKARSALVIYRVLKVKKRCLSEPAWRLRRANHLGSSSLADFGSFRMAGLG